MHSRIAPPPTFTPQEMEALIQPLVLTPLAAPAWEQLAAYTRLVFRWNQKMSLTAVRDPHPFASLHLAECVRLGQSLPTGPQTLLDFGSGAGLPAIPIMVARPELRVTLAESQMKKSSFLREALRELELPQGSVFAGRVEDMPISQVFDIVALRAVDNMQSALTHAGRRIASGGHCAVLTSMKEVDIVLSALPFLNWLPADPIPQTAQRVILLGRRPNPTP